MVLNLTKKFTLNELCKSDTARRLRIKNAPSPADIERLKALCEKVLQPLRDYLGEPVVISSGYRCPSLNFTIGGANNSQHMKGEAADIKCNGYLHAKKIYTWIIDNLEFDQVILENTIGKVYWVHVSYCASRKNRQQALVIGSRTHVKH